MKKLTHTIKRWIVKDEELTNRWFTKKTQIIIKVCIVLVTMAWLVYCILKGEGIL